MSSRTYPRDVWVLQPSFKPVQITVTKKYGSYTNYDYGDLSDKGKLYAPESMFESKGAAIADGRERCAKLRADLEKREENLCKKIAALNKAEGI